MIKVSRIQLTRYLLLKPTIDKNLRKATIRPNVIGDKPKIDPPSGGSNVTKPWQTVLLSNPPDDRPEELKQLQNMLAEQIKGVICLTPTEREELIKLLQWQVYGPQIAYRNGAQIHELMTVLEKLK